MTDTDRVVYADDPIEINVGRRRVSLTVRNTGDRAVQVGSHYHFFEANRALRFDREKAYGMHLDIPAGTAVRIEPGDTHHVNLVEYGGGMRVVGFAGLVDGGLRTRNARIRAMRRLDELGYANEPEPSATIQPAGGGKPEKPAGRAKAEKPAAPKKSPSKKKG